MRALSCKDLGEKDNFVAVGKTDSEVIDKMKTHIMNYHREKYSQISPKKGLEMEIMMKDRIYDY